MNKFHRWEDFLNSSIDAWQYHSLGELFSNRQEKNRPELPLLAVTGASGVIDRDKLERRDTSNADKSKYLRVAKGDIVYNTMRMWQGVSGSAYKDGIVSPAYTVATPTNLLDKKFAKYLVKNELLIQNFHQNSQGLVSDTLNLKFPNFASIHVQVPPLPEQKKIASILTSVDEVIENTQKQIDKLQDLKKATMNELLTKGIGHTEFKDSKLGRIPKEWKISPLSKCAIMVLNQVLPSQAGDAPYIGLEHIQGNSLTLLSHGTPSDVASAKNCFRRGDILFGKLRPYLRKVIRAPFEGVCSTEIWVIRAREKIDQGFIYYPLASPKFIEFSMLGSEGTHMPRAKWGHVSQYKTLLPPFSEQKKIASILTSIDETIEDKRNKLLQTESLKKSLMQDLLTGKVRVKVN